MKKYYDRGKNKKNVIATVTATALMIISFALGLIFVYDAHMKMIDLNAEQYFKLFEGFVWKMLLCSILFVIGLINMILLVKRNRTSSNEMEKIVDKTKELAQHQRLEAIGVMASNVNHEFSNLLTPIMGYTLLAMEKVPDENEALLRDLDHIYEASSKAKELVSNLLKISKRGGAEANKCFSPDGMLDTVEAILKPTCPNNVKVIKKYNCKDEVLCANETQIIQVMMNIIINAFQALSKKGGEVTISTDLINGYVVIRISDNGPGISEEDLKHIKEPFYTTKKDEGTGLGLAIVEQIIANHRGKFIINSKLGIGSEFIISLPANLDNETNKMNCDERKGDDNDLSVR